MPSGPDPQRRSVTTLRSPFQRPQHWHSVFTESGRGPVGPFGFSRLWLLPAPSRGLAHQARQSLCRRAGARQPKPAAHFGPVWAYFYGAFSGCNRRAERPQAATSGGAGQRHADRHTPAGRRHADRHNPAGRDAGRYGIHVNAICPGPIESEMTRGYAYNVAAQPIARMGTPRDVALAVTFPGLADVQLRHRPDAQRRRRHPGLNGVID
jgi:Enoyl-(Acyl carrier protein) reductase